MSILECFEEFHFKFEHFGVSELNFCLAKGKILPFAEFSYLQRVKILPPKGKKNITDFDEIPNKAEKFERGLISHSCEPFHIKLIVRAKKKRRRVTIFST